MTPDIDKIALEVAKELDAYFLTAAGGNKNALPTKEVWNKEFARRLVKRIQQEQKAVGYLPAYELERAAVGHDGRFRSARFGPSVLDGDLPIFTFPPATPSAAPDGYVLIKTDIPAPNIAPFKYYPSENLFMIAGREWQLVPKEPTPAMQAAGENERRRNPYNMNPWHVWNAMLSAAPAPAGEKKECE